MKNAYERRSDAARYDGARDLSPETKAHLMAELQAIVGTSPIHIVDLGCGTGRFSGALSEAFGCPVTGVEPSKAMLEVAQLTHAENPNVTLERGSANAISLKDASITLVFMSQVWHHLPDKGAALAEIWRVLGPGGFLAICNATRETNNGVNLPWLRFFSEAVVTENVRIPSYADAAYSEGCRSGF